MAMCPQDNNIIAFGAPRGKSATGSSASASLAASGPLASEEVGVCTCNRDGLCKR